MDIEVSGMTEQQAFARVFFEVTDYIPSNITLERIERETIKSKSTGLAMALLSLTEIDFGDFAISENTTIGELREQAKKLGLIH